MEELEEMSSNLIHTYWKHCAAKSALLQILIANQILFHSQIILFNTHTHIYKYKRICFIRASLLGHMNFWELITI